MIEEEFKRVKVCLAILALSTFFIEIAILLIEVKYIWSH